MTKIKQVELKIRKKIEKLLTTGEFILNDGYKYSWAKWDSGCILSAIVYPTTMCDFNDSVAGKASRKLGISIANTRDLECGYGGIIFPGCYDNDWYQLGQRLRQDYYEST